MSKATVFLSHSSRDYTFCERLVTALEQAQIDVWYDGRDMEYGSTISQEVAPELVARPVFLLVLSKAALSSPYVFAEFDVAHYLKLFDTSIGRLIIPIACEKLELSDFRNGWPFLLTYPQIAGPAGNPLPFDELVSKTINAIPSAKDVPPAPTPRADQALPKQEAVLDLSPDKVPTAWGGNSLAVPSEQRLAVFLVLDTSTSMDGDPIIAVNNGVRTLYNELVCHLETVDAVRVSVVTFSNIVDSAPLTALSLFIPPVVTARNLHNEGGTALGGALERLKEALADLPVTEQAYIFLLTDGEPTDGAVWYPLSMELKYNYSSQIGAFVGLGCGPAANIEILSQICNETLLMPELTPRAIREYFGWVARRVQDAEQSLRTSGPGQLLPPPLALPDGIQRID